jgi:hypothetical protein
MDSLELYKFTKEALYYIAYSYTLITIKSIEMS